VKKLCRSVESGLLRSREYEVKESRAKGGIVDISEVEVDVESGME
jgi:hypothetical protein